VIWRSKEPPIGKIQRPYCNPYESIWEYQSAFDRGEIDLSFVIEGSCPHCARRRCLRRIGSYQRGVIELFPYRVGVVSVARFMCRKQGRTVLYLPFQLAPYFRYSVRTIILALMLTLELREEPSLSLWSVVEQLPADCSVTSWLLRSWLWALIKALRRSHSTLARLYRLSALASADSRGESWPELLAYGMVLWRGPPNRKLAIRRCLLRYSEETSRHFLGTPSQERGALRLA